MIEPSTGVIYKIDACPYEGIEFVFNHENFWICMQAPFPHSDARAKPNAIHYDLNDASGWERVLPTKSSKVHSPRIVHYTVNAPVYVLELFNFDRWRKPDQQLD